MAEDDHPAAFYAAGTRGWRAWWTLLHPPYTLWHLSYVAIGAGLAPRFEVGRLVATIVAFFLALGIAAHALDELNGRPLGTTIPDRVLVVVATATLAGAAGIGVVMLVRIDPTPAFAAAAVAAIVGGILLVVAYTLELLGGRVHTDAGFAAAWGGFPVIVAYAAQAEQVGVAALLAGAAAFAISWAQRALSTPARFVRRETVRVGIEVEAAGGSTRRHDEKFLLGPLEDALRALSWGVVLLAAAIVAARLVGS
jgi:hypothetical protein